MFWVQIFAVVVVLSLLYRSNAANNSPNSLRKMSEETFLFPSTRNALNLKLLTRAERGTINLNTIMPTQKLTLKIVLRIAGSELSTSKKTDVFSLRTAIITAISQTVPVPNSQCIPCSIYPLTEETTMLLRGNHPSYRYFSSTEFCISIATNLESIISTLQQLNLSVSELDTEETLTAGFTMALLRNSGNELVHNLVRAMHPVPFAVLSDVDQVRVLDVSTAVIHIQGFPSAAPTALPVTIQASSIPLNLIIIIGVIVDFFLLVSCCVTVYVTSRPWFVQRRQHREASMSSDGFTAADSAQRLTAPPEMEPAFPVIATPPTGMPDLEVNTQASEHMDLVLSPMSSMANTPANFRRSMRSDASDFDFRLDLAMVSIRPGVTTQVDTPMSRLSPSSSPMGDDSAHAARTTPAE